MVSQEYSYEEVVVEKPVGVEVVVRSEKPGAQAPVPEAAVKPAAVPLSAVDLKPAAVPLTAPASSTAVEQQVKAVEEKPKPPPEHEVSLLNSIADKLDSLGYHVSYHVSSVLRPPEAFIPYELFPQKFQEHLGYVRSAIIMLISDTIDMIQAIRSYYGGMRGARPPEGLVRDEEFLVHLMFEALTAPSASRLAGILDTASTLHLKYRDQKISPKVLVNTLTGSIEQKARLASDESVKEFFSKEADRYRELLDRDRVRDLLSRFFLVMDFTRKEIYNDYMSRLGEGFQALAKAVSNQSISPRELELALQAYEVLKELDAKGYLDISKLQNQHPKLRETLPKSLEKKYEAIDKGELPARSPKGHEALVEILPVADVLRQLSTSVYNNVYARLEPVLGRSGANVVASALSGLAAGGVATAVGAIPGVGKIALGSMLAVSIADSIAEISSWFETPEEKEAFIKFFNEHKEELIATAVVAVTASLIGGYAAAKGIEKISPMLERLHVRIAEKISPMLRKAGLDKLADKIDAKIRIIEGVKKEELTDFAIWIDDEGLHIARAGRGELVNTVKKHFSNNLRTLLRDEEGKGLLTLIARKMGADSKDGRVVVPEDFEVFVEVLDDLASRHGVSTAKEFLKNLANSIEKERLSFVMVRGVYSDKGFAGIVGLDKASDRIIIMSPGKNLVKLPITRLFEDFGLTALEKHPQMIEAYTAVKLLGINIDDLVSAVKTVSQNQKVGRIKLADNVFVRLGVDDNIELILGRFLYKLPKDPTAVANILKGLSSLDDFLKQFGDEASLATFKAVQSYLATKHGMIVSPHVVADYRGLKIIYDYSDVVKQLTAPEKSAYNTIITKNGVVTVYKGVVDAGGDKILADTVALSRVFKEGRVFKTYGYEDFAITTISLPPKALEYVGQAMIKHSMSPEHAFRLISTVLDDLVKTGSMDVSPKAVSGNIHAVLSILKEGAELASSKGDVSTAVALANVQKSILSQLYGLSFNYAVSLTGNGVTFYTALPGSLTQAFTSIPILVSSGRFSEAQSLLTKSLINAGLPAEKASQIASAYVSTYATVIPRFKPKPRVIPDEKPETKSTTTIFTKEYVGEDLIQDEYTAVETVVETIVVPVTVYKAVDLVATETITPHYTSLITSLMPGIPIGLLPPEASKIEEERRLEELRRRKREEIYV